MNIKESVRLPLIFVVVIAQFLIIITNINNFSSLHNYHKRIQSDIDKERAEQGNHLTEIKRELSNELSQGGNRSLFEKVLPSEIEKIGSENEQILLEQRRKQQNKENIIIAQ